jgi:hypothetical protein
MTRGTQTKSEGRYREAVDSSTSEGAKPILSVNGRAGLGDPGRDSPDGQGSEGGSKTMKRIAMAAVVVGMLAWIAAPAQADDQMTARDIQAAVDSYVASANQDASLVGGPGSAGYDAGFWIRGGDFSLRINLTLQARYELFDFDDAEEVPGGLAAGQPGGGDLSGFSLPRAILKFSGTAPCNMRYYIEMDFGHAGDNIGAGLNNNQLPGVPQIAGRNTFPWFFQSQNGSNTREAWIEWGYSDALNFRMGQIRTPNTRQLMIAPELQQFVDISMASAVTGVHMPGYTDRNRDHGFMLHGVLGCNNEFGYMLAVTNGDGGDSIRNVLDLDTSDNLAFSGRINWAFLEPIGYTEGATRQSSCVWYGELGLWGYYYADRVDKPHLTIWDRLVWGGDLALGYGGFSFTSAITLISNQDSAASFAGAPPIPPGPGYQDEDWLIFLVQAGYHFPDTAWEIAARWSYYERDFAGATPDPATNEFGFAINYYLNGHSNKLQVDASFISPEGAPKGGGYYDVYAGVPLGFNSQQFNSQQDAVLLRFQWQLAL